MRIIRLLTAICISSVFIFTLTGCNSLEEVKKSIDEAREEKTESIAPNKNIEEKTDADVGEILQNSFFNFMVNETEIGYSINGNLADDMESSCLRVNITVEDTYEDDLPVGAYDYYISWGDGENECVKPMLSESSNAFPSQYKMKKNELLTGDLYFSVPVDVSSFTLKYVEYYGNESENNDSNIENTEEGKTYAVDFNVNIQDKAERIANIRSTMSTKEYNIAEISEVFSTEKFSVCVTGAVNDDGKGLKAADYVPKNEYKLVKVNMDVIGDVLKQQTGFEINKFYIYWGCEKSSRTLPLKYMSVTKQFEDITGIDVGVSLNGDMYFEVPKSENAFVMEYDDDNNVYAIKFNIE